MLGMFTLARSTLEISSGINPARVIEDTSNPENEA